MTERVLNYRVPPVSVAPEQPLRLVIGLVAWSMVIVIALATIYLYAKDSMGIVLSYLGGIPASIALASAGLFLLPPRRRWGLLAWWSLPLLASLCTTFWLAYRGAQGID